MTGTWSELYKAGYQFVKRPKWAHGGMLRLWVDEKGKLQYTSVDHRGHTVEDDQLHHLHKNKTDWVGVDCG